MTTYILCGNNIERGLKIKINGHEVEYLFDNGGMETIDITKAIEYADFDGDVFPILDDDVLTISVF